MCQYSQFFFITKNYSIVTKKLLLYYYSTRPIRPHRSINIKRGDLILSFNDIIYIV